MSNYYEKSALTATGTRDFVATISIDCQEPVQYKQIFIKKIYRKRKIKPLSVKDYLRLQGFPDSFMISEIESIAKKQLGNAVTVPVVLHLVQSLLKVIL